MPRFILYAAAALFAWTSGAAVSYGSYRSPFPPPSEIHVPVQGAAGDMFALAFGARRLFADVWFIRLMQYFGAPEFEKAEEAAADEERAEHEHHHHHHSLEGGKYPEFQARALHILEIDPGFTMAALYGAGSLAFNLGKPREAQAVLEYALKYSPKNWKYLNMLAALGYYKNAEAPQAVADALAPILKDPDCPVMLKQQAAFLNKRIGNYAAAAAIYADIAATSRDTAYVRNAERELSRLAEKAR